MSDFEVSEDMKKWAKDHFDNMGIGGVWSPEGTGLTHLAVIRILVLCNKIILVIKITFRLLIVDQKLRPHCQRSI